MKIFKRRRDLDQAGWNRFRGLDAVTRRTRQLKIEMEKRRFSIHYSWRMEFSIIEQNWRGNGILTAESSFWKVGLALPLPQLLKELLGTHELAQLPRNPQDSAQVKKIKCRVWRQLLPKYPTSLIVLMPHKMALKYSRTDHRLSGGTFIFPFKAFFVDEKKFEKKMPVYLRRTVDCLL